MTINAGINSSLELIVCDSCELGILIERKRIYFKNKVTDALARIHVDSSIITPKNLKGHEYVMILTAKTMFER